MSCPVPVCRWCLGRPVRPRVGAWVQRSWGGDPKEGGPLCPFRGGETWPLSVAGSLTRQCFLLRRLSLALWGRSPQPVLLPCSALPPPPAARPPRLQGLNGCGCSLGTAQLLLFCGVTLAADALPRGVPRSDNARADLKNRGLDHLSQLSDCPDRERHQTGELLLFLLRGVGMGCPAIACRVSVIVWALPVTLHLFS